MAARSETTIDVAFATDDAYAMPLAVAARSLLERVAPPTRVRLFVIDGGLSRADRARLLASWPSERLEVRWLPARPEDLGGVLVSGHVPLASYFRLLLPALVPASVERILYLDGDLVVLRDVAELWTVDLRGRAMAAAQDLYAGTVSQPNGLSTWRDLDLPPDRPYWNAGVLLVDLARWRREEVGERALRYVREQRRRVRWWDQDGLNAVAGGDCLALDPRWNVSLHFDGGGEDAVSGPDRDTLLREAFVCHYASRIKPWHTDCRHPRKDLFFDVLARTRWAGFRPQRASSDRTLAQRVRTLLRHARDRGPAWALLDALRALGGPVAAGAERRMLAIERRRFLVGADTVATRRLDRDDERRRRDAAVGGSDAEWAKDAAELRGLDPARWRRAIVDDLLVPNAGPGAVVLELGPGAGTWSAVLRPLARRLLLAETSPRAIALCRERFDGAANVEIHRIEAPVLGFAASGSVDFAWSYDFLVHASPTDVDRHLGEIARALRPGGTAALHHAGTYAAGAAARRPRRSIVDAAFFAALARRRGLELVAQDERHAHLPGDLISIVRRPAAG